MALQFIVVAEFFGKDEASMTLPPCGVFSTLEKARAFITEHYEGTKIIEPWDEMFESEMHRSTETFGNHEDIYIWGKCLDEE